MKITLVTVGEPLPILGGVKDRPLRTGYFSQFLAERGHDVTWWTSAFDHSRKIMLSELGDTVPVRQGLEIRAMNGGGYKANVSIARIRDHRNLAKKFAIAVRQAPRPDIILSSLPPVELSLAAVEFGEEAGVPVVLDMRDMWPDIFVDEFPAWTRWAARSLLTPLFRQAKRAAQGATAITGITQGFVDWGLQRGNRAGSEFDKPFPMGYAIRIPTTEDIANAEAFWSGMGILPDSSERTICFLGNMGRMFDLGPVIQGAARLAQRQVPVRFVLCGVGERLQQNREMAAGLSNVILPGWIDEARIYVLLRRSYAGIDPLPDRYDYLATLNNKAIEYLSAGVPVLSSPARGVLAQTLAIQDCGASCAANDSDAFVNLVEHACTHPEIWARKASNARAFFEAEFAAEKVYARFYQHLELIITSYKRGDAGRS